MRIISGKYKGRNLIGFNINGTRPTMDRVKESLFGSIQNYIKDSNVLDLFAGSGALGIEALSNGAKSCVFVDNNSELIRVINNNISNIGIKEEISIIKNDYINALEYFNDKRIKFDIVFLDPPYSLNLINNCLNKIGEYGLLKENGIVVCEYENENISFNKFQLLKEKKYGTKNIKIFINK